MNNEVLIDALAKFKVLAEPSGRNDIHVNGRKVSGSAYKLSLGKKDGTGKKSLHHGTMLLNLDLNALQKYLNPNKLKLISKGVDSVVSRVLNLSEIVPDITHEQFCNALAGTFRKKWHDKKLNERVLSIKELEAIPKVMELYENMNKWEWRFGETP